ncbi:Holliday junction resolvase RuvX, partial [Eubacteriales bacterium OttesenSCG-928-A19]|nr:Holliday junction resolvase RuvX [Eubacteriales bacterium OttesenSCG-928-A19]
NMDGSEGAQAEKVRAFAAQLEKAGFEVVFWDERLSTVTAERALIEGGLRREARRGVVDQTAAAIILRAYLDAQGSIV